MVRLLEGNFEGLANQPLNYKNHTKNRRRTANKETSYVSQKSSVEELSLLFLFTRTAVLSFVMNYIVAHAHGEMNPKKRHTMEDVHRVLPILDPELPQYSYFGVYDGEHKA